MRISPLDLLKWIHFIFLGTSIGAGVVALLLSGFEQDRKDLEGLAATVWKKAVVWPLRLAVLVGILALVQKIQWHMAPFKDYYLHFKLALVLPLLASAEMAPRMLAAGRRGAAMVTLLLLLLISGIVYNKGLFGRAAATPANLPNAAEMAPAK
jgi:uncharacterized membrane protein